MALDELGAEFGLRTQVSRLKNNRQNPAWFVIHLHSARCHKSFAPPSGPMVHIRGAQRRLHEASQLRVALLADDVLKVPCRNDMDISA